MTTQLSQDDSSCTKTMKAAAVQFLVETPRGKTATAWISPSCTYDSFVACLWDAAQARDQDEKYSHKRTLCDHHDSGDCRRNTRPRLSRATMVLHCGKVVDADSYHRWFLSSPSSSPSLLNSNQHQHHHISLKLRLRGGVDRQNRVGSKFGGGGVSSSQNAERERKERLKQLALESIDLAKDPYLMRNHLGTYECKLCLTLHTNEANYLAHTQGKKHQAGLARRAHMEKLREKEQQQLPLPMLAESKQAAAAAAPRRVRIGRPAYQVFKSRDPDTNQRCLSFELQYPEIDADVQPRHRFMSAYEQRVDTPPDRRYQYLLIAAEPYETVAFKIPNEPIDKGEGRFVTHWDVEDKKFTLSLYLVDPEEQKETTN